MEDESSSEPSVCRKIPVQNMLNFVNEW